MYDIYQEHKHYNIPLEKKIYDRDFLKKHERYDIYYRTYERISDQETTFVATRYDSSGHKLMEYTRHYWVFGDAPQDRIGYKHGDYFNLSVKDSSRYYPLAEGRYDRGARVGEWTFFDARGRPTHRTHYPEKPTATPDFIVYDESGEVAVIGLYGDRKRRGKWRFYEAEKLVREEMYDTAGEKISSTRFIGEAIEITPYRNHRKHGKCITFDRAGRITQVESYENGHLHGTSIFFNEDGTLQKASNFVRAREFTVERNDAGAPVVNGFLHGYAVYYNAVTGEKSSEGEFWNGYAAGTWISYRDKGSYQKSYYPTDPQELMYRCSSSPLLIEDYDKNEQLIRSHRY